MTDCFRLHGLKKGGLCRLRGSVCQGEVGSQGEGGRRVEGGPRGEGGLQILGISGSRGDHRGEGGHLSFSIGLAYQCAQSWSFTDGDSD